MWLPRRSAPSAGRFVPARGASSIAESPAVEPAGGATGAVNSSVSVAHLRSKSVSKSASAVAAAAAAAAVAVAVAVARQRAASVLRGEEYDRCGQEKVRGEERRPSEAHV